MKQIGYTINTIFTCMHEADAAHPISLLSIWHGCKTWTFLAYICVSKVEKLTNVYNSLALECVISVIKHSFGGGGRAKTRFGVGIFLGTHFLLWVADALMLWL